MIVKKAQIPKLLAPLVLLLGAAFQARAEIITFDGLAGTPMAGASFLGATYTGYAPGVPATVGGYQFSSTGPEYFLGAPYSIACCGGDLGPLAYNGTDYLIGLPDITVSQVGGGAFALKGFDLAEWDNTFTASINLTTLGPSGITSQTLPLSAFGNAFITTGNDFSHFSLTGYDNVLSFTLTGSVSWAFFAIDNLEVTSAVPEPESYAMLLAGLGFLGLIARRRKLLRAS